MGRRSGLAEGGGAVIILFIFLPIKLMIDKYYKDGFFGLIKALLSIVFFVFFLIGLYGAYDIEIKEQHGIYDYYTANGQIVRLNEAIKENQSELVNAKGSHYNTLKNTIEEQIEHINNYEKLIMPILFVYSLTLLSLFISVWLFKISSSSGKEDGFVGSFKAFLAIILLGWFVFGLYYINETELTSHWTKSKIIEKIFNRSSNIGVRHYIASFNAIEKAARKKEAAEKILYSLNGKRDSYEPNNGHIAHSMNRHLDEVLKLRSYHSASVERNILLQEELIKIHLPLLASFFIALYLSIKLFEGSSKRSRALALAQREQEEIQNQYINS